MLLTIVLFVALLGGCFGVMLLFTRPSHDAQRVQARIRSIRTGVSVAGGASGGAEAEPEVMDREADSMGAMIAAALQRLPLSAVTNTLLAQSHSALSLNGFCLVSLCFAAGVGCLAAAFCPGLLALACGALGACVPALWLRHKRNRRLAAFNLSLPNAIELMVRALHAGHSVQQMLDVVAEQTRLPICGEFAQVQQEQRLGVPFREAMLALSQRMPSKDLRFVVTAILVQKETGGDLTEILDRTAFVIRERMRVEGEIRTHTAQGRLSGWVLSLLPVGLLACLTLVSPDYATVLFHDPAGVRMMEAGVVMLVAGGLVIRKIVQVEV